MRNWLWILLFVILAPASAYASLGGDVPSVERDNQTIKGARKATQMQAYTVHEITSDGVTVKEYASSAGKVFAVSWRGMHQPDLTTLFGDYYSEYRAEEIKQTPSRARHAEFNSANVVVRKSGHMRDMRGKAFIPALVPAGVDLGDLQ